MSLKKKKNTPQISEESYYVTKQVFLGEMTNFNITATKKIIYITETFKTLIIKLPIKIPASACPRKKKKSFCYTKMLEKKMEVITKMLIQFPRANTFFHIYNQREKGRKK